MARYATTLRTARIQQIRAAASGGKLYLAKGTPALAIPTADKLTEHVLSSNPGAVVNGTWTIGQEHITADESATGQGVATHVVVADSGGAPVAMYPQAEVVVTITPAPGDTQIEPGRYVIVSSVVINEGGV